MDETRFDQQDSTGQVPGAERETGAVGSERLGGTGVGSGPDDVGVGGAIGGGGGRETGVPDDEDDTMPDYDSERLGGTGVGSAPGDVGVGGAIGGGGYGDAPGGQRDRLEDRT